MLVPAFAIRDGYWYPAGDIDVNPRQGAPSGYTFTDPRTLNPSPDQWVRRGSSAFWELTNQPPAWDVDWYAARIEEARQQRYKDVGEWYCDTYIRPGMPYNISGQDVRIMAKSDDVSNLQGVFLMAREQLNDGAPPDAPWAGLTTLSTDGATYIDVIISRNQALAIGESMFAHLGAAHQARRTHKKNLDALTTIEEINSYVIS